MTPMMKKNKKGEYEWINCQFVEKYVLEGRNLKRKTNPQNFFSKPQKFLRKRFSKYTSW